MSSSDRYSPYGPTAKQGSRWDRPSKDGWNDQGTKRRLPSNEDSAAYSNDEPEIKKSSLNSQGMKFNMGQPTSGKITMKLGGGESGATEKASPAIKLSLGANKPKEAAPVAVPKPKTLTVAQAFNDDESSDEEEMPPEAKMRMRNLGKETPTAAGPNSFGKNRLGFCDRQKVIQRELQKKMDELSKQSE